MSLVAILPFLSEIVARFIKSQFKRFAAVRISREKLSTKA
jgi:hypothetical protein